MTSSEQLAAYSDDLRWRMVWQCEGLGYSMTQVAKNLGVDKATVSRTVNLFNATGSLAKKMYPKHKAFRLLTIPAQMLVLNLVVERPGTFLREIQKELVDVLQLEVDISTILL